jgi:pimeloyl-ACP methyl ester carboxylesterase
VLRVEAALRGRAAGTVAQVQLAHDRSGSGPPLLLIHGIGSRRGVWRPLLPFLVGERETIAVDLPGFGDSPPLPPGVEPTVEALAGAVAAFAEQQGLDRPHVAGNSLGGGISLELGRRGVVGSVAVLSPIGFWSPAEARTGAMLLRMSRLFARHARGPAQRLARSPRGRKLAFGLYYGHPELRDGEETATDVEALGRAPGWEETLPHTRRYVFHDGDELRAPVTIGWGTHDRLLIPRQAERARAALPAARHVPLPGCGHVPMSDDPEGVAALLLAASA